VEHGREGVRSSATELVTGGKTTAYLQLDNLDDGSIQSWDMMILAVSTCSLCSLQWIRANTEGSSIYRPRYPGSLQILVQAMDIYISYRLETPSIGDEYDRAAKPRG
jgi:hypothetical protein